MENFGYLFAAYTIIFAVLFVYLMFLWGRQRRLDGAVAALERRLAELTSKPSKTRSAS